MSQQNVNVLWNLTEAVRNLACVTWSCSFMTGNPWRPKYAESLDFHNLVLEYSCIEQEPSHFIYIPIPFVLVIPEDDNLVKVSLLFAKPRIEICNLLNQPLICEITCVD